MPQPAVVDNETSHAILMPFENGDIARVTLSLYKAPKGQSRPIDAYVVTECEGDFTGAARRAAEAVYNLAQKRLPRIGQMVIGLDIQGLSPGSAPVTGESGGLSFAVAIAGELFKKKLPIAATGVVSSRENGKVDRVEGIVKKLTAAAEIIPQQGRILYPADNHDEIPESVFRLARDKRITLHPVTTIAEAIYAAYGIKIENNQINNHSRLKKISAGILVLLAIALSISLFMNKSHQKVQPQVKSIPAVKAEATTVAEIVTPPPLPVPKTDKKNIPVNVDMTPPALPFSGTEEKRALQPPTPASEKGPDQHAKSTSRPEKKYDISPAPASSEPFYPDAGFE